VAQKGILSYNIESKQELYGAYMPFLLNGGLFLPTRKTFTLGDEVLILLSLMGDERIAIPGRIAWITPPGSQRGGSSGVGIQFADSAEGQYAQTAIVSVLAGMLESERPTHTM